MAVENDSVLRVAVGRTSERLWTRGGQRHLRSSEGIVWLQAIHSPACHNVSRRDVGTTACRATWKVPRYCSRGQAIKACPRVQVRCSMRRGGERSSPFACEVGPVLCRNEGQGKGRGCICPHWPSGGRSVLSTLRIERGRARRWRRTARLPSWSHSRLSLSRLCVARHMVSWARHPVS